MGFLEGQIRSDGVGGTPSGDSESKMGFLCFRCAILAQNKGCIGSAKRSDGVGGTPSGDSESKMSPRFEVQRSFPVEICAALRVLGS